MRAAMSVGCSSAAPTRLQCRSAAASRPAPLLGARPAPQQLRRVALGPQQQKPRQQQPHSIQQRQQEQQQRRQQQQRAVAAAAAGDAAAQPGEALSDAVSEVARQNLKKAAAACRRYGWISFWVQLVLNTVAAVVLLFSLAFTSQNGPGISLYLTLFGIVLGFLSLFWSFGYVRLSRRLRAFLDAPTLDAAPKIRRSDVIAMLEKGAIINVLGAGATMLGLSATIGVLLAKTLTSATVNPFLATSSNNWNPVLAFDVFNVQATTNALLAHFFSLVVSLWLLRIIANRPSAGQMMATGAPSAA